jgi:hypothetical protein
MWDIGCARATCCAREVIYFLCTLNGILGLFSRPTRRFVDYALVVGVGD